MYVPNNDPQNKQTQALLYFMAWNVATNTGNYYASTSKITNPKTTAEWIEFQGTTGGYKGTQGGGVSGTSYDINKLYKTQPSSYVNRGTVNNMKDSIKNGGSEAVPPITVRVHNNQALIVDGHHRLQAFSELGYDRVPIKYIHENQIVNYGRTLTDLLGGMYK